MEENKNQEPKIFYILKIIAFSLLVGGIVLLIVLNIIEPALLFLGIIMIFFSFPAFVIGFIPQIKKTAIKTQKYLQQENKEDLTDIANTSADISSEAITKTTRAIKKGIRDTKFCKHCGAEIDADSKFCKSCGKEQ